MAKHLDLSNQELSDFKVKDGDLEDVTRVDISDNNFKAIPQELQQVSNLQVLICSRNKVQISDSKSGIVDEELDFFKPKQENKFILDNPEDSIYSDEDEEEVSKNTTEESTSFDSGIQLSEKFFDFSNLKNLFHLSLSHNNIDSLPQSLFRFRD